MPRVPVEDSPDVVTSGQLPSERISVSPADFGGGAAAGLGEAANHVMHVFLTQASLANETAARQADVDADNKIYSYLFDPQTGYLNKEGNAAVDAYGNVQPDLNAIYQSVREGLPNDAARRIYDSSALYRLAHAQQTAGQYAAGQNKQYQLDTSKARVDNLIRSAATYANDSNNFQQTLGAAQAEIDNQAFIHGYGPDSDWAKNQKQIVAQGAWFARAQRKMLEDPQTVLNWVNGDKSPESEGLRSSVQPEHLLTLQTHAEALLHRNDAQADRAENAAYNQIESGIPTNPQDKVQRDSILLSAGRADVVKALNDEENDVQTAAHGTFQQQNDLLRDKQTELLQHGGNLKDWQRFTRLHNALGALQKQADERPFDYGATRLGLPVDPINVGDFNDQSKLGALNQELTKRAAVLDTVKNTTGHIPRSQGLLQPDEAAQLAGTLQNSAPELAPQLLKKVYQAIGDPDRFQHTVQQILPGNDPLAGAAIIAATGGKIQTGSAGGTLGFGTHPTYTTADEAASLISVGRRLLHPTPQDEKERGEKATMPMPKDTGATGMSAKFSEYVGNTFADAPNQAALAYETFKSAYAGLAAKDGDRAGKDSKSKDARIKQALKIALGNSVTFGDKSTTLAPWGMDEATFKDQAEQKVAAQVQALHLPQNLSEQFKDGQIGLRASGFNKYDLIKSGQPIPGVRIDFNNRGSLAVPTPKGVLDDVLRQPQPTAEPTVSASETPPGGPAAQPTTEPATPPEGPAAKPAPAPASRKGMIDRSGQPVPRGPKDSEIDSTALRANIPSRTEPFVVGNTTLELMPVGQRRALPHDAPALDDYATAVERKLGLPPGILLAIKNSGERSGSTGRHSVSPVGAKGVMQFMGDTARAFGLTDPTDPLASIQAAGRYIRENLQVYNGNVPAAIADYNGGPRAARAVLAGREPPKEETRGYLQRVLRGMADFMLSGAVARP